MWVCSGASPSGAARKVKGKSGAFYLKEMTKGSKKKLYGPYSSKKKVVQRGGEEKRNILREMICENVLNILKRCDDKFDPEMSRINTRYEILEQTYVYLGIDSRMDKCIVLKYIINLRDIYTIINNGTQKEFPLCHCLCNLKPADNNVVELGFINSYFDLIMSKIKSLTIHNKNDFYEKNWSKFIQFLRNIIRQIEVDKLEQNKKELSNLNAEVKKAKANFHKGMEARNLGSPAEEKKNYRPPPNLLRARRNVTQKPTQPSRNNQKDGPAKGTPESHKILEERLAALRAALNKE
jgi:hypothetical protein